VQQWALEQKKMEAIIAWITDKTASTYIYISEPYTTCDFDRPWIPKKAE
jgi:hypothetical protein